MNQTGQPIILGKRRNGSANAESFPRGRTFCAASSARLRLGLIAFLVLLGLLSWANLAQAAEPGAANPDVIDLADSLGLVTRLVLYGLVFLGLCLACTAAPDAPMLLYLFSLPIVQFGGFGVVLMLLQLAVVLFRTRDPGLLVPSWLLSLFLLCLVASGSWALDPKESVFGEYAGIASALLQLPSMLAVASLLRSNLTTMRRLLWALALGSIPGCIQTAHNALAGVQYLEGNQVGGEETGYYMGLIAPDIFSNILVMSGVFLMFCLTSPKLSIRSRVCAGLVLSVISVGLLLSGIRSGWLAFSLATLLLVVRTRSWAAITSVLLVMSIVGFLGFSSAVGLNLNEKMSARLSEKSMHSGELRLQFWEVAGHGFVKRPILGIGWGGFPAFAADNTVGRKFATHNLFVRVACELGLVGLGLFFAWLVRTMVKLRWGNSTGVLIRVLILAVLVQGLFLDLFVYSHFWVFLGVCDAAPVDESFRPGEWLSVGHDLTDTEVSPLAT